MESTRNDPIVVENGAGVDKMWPTVHIRPHELFSGGFVGFAIHLDRAA